MWTLNRNCCFSLRVGMNEIRMEKTNNSKRSVASESMTDTNKQDYKDMNN
jgi:hypothetical protein